jgi:hypothetical protein
MRWVPPVTRDVLHTDVAVCRESIDREVSMPVLKKELVSDECTRRAPAYDWVCAPKLGHVPAVEYGDRLCPVTDARGCVVGQKLTSVPVGTRLEQVAVGEHAVRIPVGAVEVTGFTGTHEVDVYGRERRVEHLRDKIHVIDRGQVVEKREILPGRWVAEQPQVQVPGYWVRITCDPAQADGRTVMTRPQYDALVSGAR